MVGRKILSLEFNEKFIRTWEYYFDYCAAGFKTHTLGNYQVNLKIAKLLLNALCKYVSSNLSLNFLETYHACSKYQHT